MKRIRTIFVLYIPAFLYLECKAAIAQGEAEEDSIEEKSISKPQEHFKPELFSSGFIDIFNSGQVNASARFIRLYIGEPGKFTLPVSLYSGVSSNNFTKSTSENQTNDVLMANFINPLSGLVNISIDAVHYFRKNEKLTKVGLLYHVGERLLTGLKAGDEDDPEMGQPYNFLNSFGSVGLYFQTGAWERGDSKNVGVAWMAIRYIGCYTNPSQLEKFLPGISSNGFYYGCSLAWGVEINKVLNIKMVYYKYIKKPEIEYSQPIYQFSFNYSFRK